MGIQALKAILGGRTSVEAHYGKVELQAFDLLGRPKNYRYRAPHRAQLMEDMVQGIALWYCSAM